MREITLNGSTGTYFLDMVGKIGGRYVGKFIMRCYLTPIERIACDREFRDLIGKIQTGVDPNVEYLAFALTQLKYRIVSYPPFWDNGDTPIPGGQIADREIIEDLLGAANDAETKYSESLIEKHEQSLKQMSKQLQKDKKDQKINKEFAENAK